MTTKPSPAKPTGGPRGFPPDALRTVVSLLLFIHLFCVFVALGSNYSPSGLQSRFLGVVRAYTQTLNFDLNMTPYQLTHGEPIDADHSIEVLPAGKDPADPDAWLALPDSVFRGGERFKRYQRLGELVDVSVQMGRDDRKALLASSVAEYFLRQQGVKPKQVRCRRHRPIPLEAFFEGGTQQDRNPSSPGYFDLVYYADTLVDEQTQEVEINEIKAAGEVARPTTP